MSENNSLFENFKSISDEQWREQVLRDLKGKSFDESLIWKDENGLKHQPYYRKSNLESNPLIPKIQAQQQKPTSWRIVQEFSMDAENLENQVHAAFEQGVNDVVINASKNGSKSISEFKQAKSKFAENIKHIPNLHLHLKKIDLNAPTKLIFCDPIGEMLKSGEQADQEFDELKGLFQKRLNQLNPDNFLLVDGSIYKNAGATIVEELTFSLQHAVEYLDQLTEAGFTAEAVARSFTFKLGFGTSFFSEIAKSRAFRYLIQKVYQSYNVEAKVRLWGETSTYYHSDKDPYNNLIRSSTQAMSAVLGNCDLISLPSFDAMENPSSLGIRMSKNIALILKEESYFNQVQDMAAGSYYIECLSAEIAQEAWNKFCSIEKQGGLLAKVKDGSLAKELAHSAENRASNYKAEKRILVGANKFVNQDAIALKTSSNNSENISARILSQDI